MFKHRFVRFLLVGISNTVIDILIFNVLVVAGLIPLAAGVIGTSVATAWSYVLNSKKVFVDQDIKDSSKILKFLAVTFVGIYVLQYSIMFVINHYFGASLQRFIEQNINIAFIRDHAHLVVLNLTKACGFVIGIAWNYILYRKFVFKEDIKSVIEELA